MPSVTPNSPNEFSQFDGEFNHIQHHRNLETAVENLTAGTDTISTQTLIASRFGIKSDPNTSNVATIKGFHRTAAVVGKAVGWIATNSIYVATFSVEGQAGNTLQVGDPIHVEPIAALPTNAVQLGSGKVTDTNTVQVAFLANAGGINTTTVSFHVFSIDIT